MTRMFPHVQNLQLLTCLALCNASANAGLLADDDEDAAAGSGKSLILHSVNERDKSPQKKTREALQGEGPLMHGVQG